MKVKISTHAIAGIAVSALGILVANWSTIAPLVAGHKLLSAILGGAVTAYLTYRKPTNA